MTAEIRFKYITVKHILEEYPFTKGQLRQFLLSRKTNGLDKAIRKIGKTLYFRADLFEQWIEGHQ